MSLTLDVFVSSPGDMSEERKVVAEVVAKLALQPHVRRSCALRAHFYERMVPPVLASSAQAAVNTFMMDPARCDVMVCLLGNRVGTPVKDPELDPRTFRSGTEFELVKAHESPKRPKPEVLVYFRARPADATGGEAPEKDGLAELFAEFEKPDGRLQGIKPVPLEDADRLRDQLYDGLDAVVNKLVSSYSARRAIRRALAAAAVAGALALSYGLTARAESKRYVAQLAAVEQRRTEEGAVAAERAAANEARAVLATAARNSGWDEVATLDRLGCPAAAPLMKALARADGDGEPAEVAHAIVQALGNLAALAGRERCGCPELLSVLALENPVASFCKTTHRIVLQQLAGVSCRDGRRVACEYLGKIQRAGSLSRVVCEREKTSDDAGELTKAARAWLGNDADLCLEKGRRP